MKKKLFVNCLLITITLNCFNIVLDVPGDHTETLTEEPKSDSKPVAKRSMNQAELESSLYKVY